MVTIWTFRISEKKSKELFFSHSVGESCHHDRAERTEDESEKKYNEYKVPRHEYQER